MNEVVYQGLLQENKKKRFIKAVCKSKTIEARTINKKLLTFKFKYLSSLIIMVSIINIRPLRIINFVTWHGMTKGRLSGAKCDIYSTVCQYSSI